MKLTNFPMQSANTTNQTWRLRIEVVHRDDLRATIEDTLSAFPGIEPFLQKRIAQCKKEEKQLAPVVQEIAVPVQITKNSDLEDKINNLRDKYEGLKKGILSFNLINRTTFENSPVELKVFENFKDNMRRLLDTEAKLVEDRMIKENGSKAKLAMQETSSQLELAKTENEGLKDKIRLLEQEILKINKIANKPAKIDVQIIEKKEALSSMLEQQGEGITVDEMLKAENKKLNLMNNMMLKQKTKMKVQIEQLKATLAEGEGYKNDLEARLRESQFSLEAATKGAKDSKTIIDEHKSLLSQINLLNTEKTDLQRKLKTSEDFIRKINFSRATTQLPPLSSDQGEDKLIQLYTFLNKDLQESRSNQEKLRNAYLEKEKELLTSKQSKVSRKDDLNKIEELNDQISVLFQKISTLEASNNKLKGDLNMMEDKARTLEENLDAKKNELEAVETKYKNEISRLEVEIEVLRNVAAADSSKDLNEAKKSNQDCENKLNELIKEHALKTSANELSLKTLQLSNDNIQKINEELDLKIMTQKEQIESLQHKITGLEEKNIDGTDMSTRMGDLMKKLTSVQTDYDHIRSNYDTIKSELDEANQKLKEAGIVKANDKVSEEVSALKAAIGDLEAARASEKINLSLKISTLEEGLSKERQGKRSMEEIRAVLEREIEKLTADFNELSNINKEGDRLREELKEKVDRLERKDKVVCEKLKWLLSGHRGSPVFLDSNSEKLLDNIQTKFENLERQNLQLEKTILTQNLSDKIDLKTFVRNQGTKILDLLGDDEKTEDFLNIVTENRNVKASIMKRAIIAIQRIKMVSLELREVLDIMMTEVNRILADYCPLSPNFTKLKTIIHDLLRRVSADSDDVKKEDIPIALPPKPVPHPLIRDKIKHEHEDEVKLEKNEDNTSRKSSYGRSKSLKATRSPGELHTPQTRTRTKIKLITDFLRSPALSNPAILKKPEVHDIDDFGMKIDFMDRILTAPPKLKKRKRGIRTKKLDEGLVDSVRHLLAKGQVQLSDEERALVNEILDKSKTDAESMRTLRKLFNEKKTRGVKLDFASSNKKSHKKKKTK